MNIQETLTDATRIHGNFVQQYGQALPFYVRTAALLGVMLGREVSPREVAMFELAHAQTRISLNPEGTEAYTDMILASAATKALSNIKTSSFTDSMLADIESTLHDQLNGK